MAPRLHTSDLDRALEYAGTHTAADIAEAVTAGRMQRWDGDASTIITEILDSPLRRTLLFFLAEGNLRELRAMARPILEWGRQQGCTHASFVGRFGWERSFVRDLGFKVTATVMETAL
jgi:hypothetical protein